MVDLGTIIHQDWVHAWMVKFLWNNRRDPGLLWDHKREWQYIQGEIDSTITTRILVRIWERM